MIRAKAVESKSSRSTSCRLDPVHTALLAGFLCLCIPPSFPFPKNLAVVGGGKIKSCCYHPRVSSTGRVFVKQITANLKQQAPTTKPPCVRCKPLQIEKLTHRSIHPSIQHRQYGHGVASEAVGCKTGTADNSAAESGLGKNNRQEVVCFSTAP